MIQYALQYAGMGWHVFPCHVVKSGVCSCGEECDSPGKHPRTKNGLKDATTSSDKIQKWWTQWPDANIGIATGEKSGLWVLDIDGQQGKESFYLLQKQFPAGSFDVPKVMTANGAHLYFSFVPDTRNTAKRLGPGLDTRAEGGYVIAPPSLHPSGANYYWKQTIDDSPLKPPPPELVERLKKPEIPIPTGAPKPIDLKATTRYTKYAEGALKAATQNIMAATHGSRNDTLNRESFSIGTLIAAGVMQLHDAQGPLLDAAMRSGLSHGEAEKTINSGLTGGLAKPRDLNNLKDLLPPTNGNGKHPQTVKEEATIHIEEEKQSPNFIAHQVATEHKFLTDQDENIYFYNSYFWEYLTPLRAKQFLMQADRFTNQKRRNESLDHLKQITLKHPVPWRNLEVNEIPFKNGVLDVAAWKLRPHSPDDYLETVLPVNFNEKALCPLWQQCLKDWFGEGDDALGKTIALRHFFGYILMPHANYKKAMILEGPSNTGKSQVLGVIKMLVGLDNTCSIAVEEMEDSRKIAPIVGKMVNLISELSSSALIKDGGFKKLVSTGDPIQIDEKFKPARQYVPFCKHIVATNTMPSINDKSDATYNRLLVLSFLNEIPEEKIDRSLLTRLETELEGIALWAALGANQLNELEGKWLTLESSQQALDRHRREQNDFYDFVAECCIEDPSVNTPTSQVFKRYNEWKGGKALSSVAIGMKAAAAGYVIAPHFQPVINQSVRCLVAYRLR